MKIFQFIPIISPDVRPSPQTACPCDAFVPVHFMFPSVTDHDSSIVKNAAAERATDRVLTDVTVSKAKSSCIECGWSQNQKAALGSYIPIFHSGSSLRTLAAATRGG